MNSVDAVDLALACFRDPLGHHMPFASSAPLPSGMERLLALAGGATSLLDETARAKGVTPDELRQAARFLIQQICFNPNATHYRVLGLEPGATTDQIRDHYRSLRSVYQRDRSAPEAAIDLKVLLYPLRLFPADRIDSEKWSDAHEARINRAFSVLSSSASRTHYEALLQRSRLLDTTAELPVSQITADDIKSRVPTSRTTEIVPPPAQSPPIPLVPVLEDEDHSTLKEEHPGGEAHHARRSWKTWFAGHRTSLLSILSGVLLLLGLVVLLYLSWVSEGDIAGHDLAPLTDRDASHASSVDPMRLDASHSLDHRQEILDQASIMPTTEGPTAAGTEPPDTTLAPVGSEVGTPTSSLPINNVIPLTDPKSVVFMPSLGQAQESATHGIGQTAVEHVEQSTESSIELVGRVSADSDPSTVQDTQPQASQQTESVPDTRKSPEPSIPAITPTDEQEGVTTSVSEVPQPLIHSHEDADVIPPRGSRTMRALSQPGDSGLKGNTGRHRASAPTTPVQHARSSQPKRSYRRVTPSTNWKGLIGQWYDVEYLKRLEATRSPCQALVKGEVPRISIRKEGGYLYADIDHGFHKQFTVRIGKTGDTGGTKIVKSGMDDQRRSRITEKLVWQGGEQPSLTLIQERHKGKKTVFSFRPLSESGLNRIVINGVYRGWSREQEGTVTMTPEGRFSGPSMAFSFELGLDCSFTNCDYLQANDGTMVRDGTPFRYGFLRTKDGMAIFNVRYEAGGQLVCETTPLYILDARWR